MHHTNIDRLWWSWQEQNLPERYKDISGPIVPFDYDNKKAGNVTLDFMIDLGFNGEPKPVSEFMDIQGGSLCYDCECLFFQCHLRPRRDFRAAASVEVMTDDSAC